MSESLDSIQNKLARVAADSEEVRLQKEATRRQFTEEVVDMVEGNRTLSKSAEPLYSGAWMNREHNVQSELFDEQLVRGKALLQQDRQALATQQNMVDALENDIGEQKRYSA